MTIGERIKQIRQEQNLTQTELAIRMGFDTKGAVSKIEAAGDDITLKNIRKAADALCVHPSVLMDWNRKTDIETFLSDPANRDFVVFLETNIPPSKRNQYYTVIKATINALNT